MKVIVHLVTPLANERSDDRILGTRFPILWLGRLLTTRVRKTAARREEGMWHKEQCEHKR